MKRSLALFALVLAAAPVSAKGVGIERNSKILEFSFGWSAEAAANNILNARFRRDMEHAYAQAIRNAREDQKSTIQDKREFHPHEYSSQWTTAGQSARLLSLRGDFDEFTGGAHPNHGSNALTWDRRTNIQMGIGTLFTRAATFTALTRTNYCKALDKERLKKREGEKLDREFGQCPKYSELAIIPMDKDKDGRFDTLNFIASPYVAGPYAEGDYEVELPVTSRLIAALKPAHRASFEVQRQ